MRNRLLSILISILTALGIPSPFIAKVFNRYLHHAQERELPIQAEEQRQTVQVVQALSSGRPDPEILNFLLTCFYSNGLDARLSYLVYQGELLIKALRSEYVYTLGGYHYLNLSGNEVVLRHMVAMKYLNKLFRENGYDAAFPSKEEEVKIVIGLQEQSYVYTLGNRCYKTLDGEVALRNFNAIIAQST